MISIWVWIIRDTYKSLGIRKVSTIVTLPNKDKPLIIDTVSYKSSQIYTGNTENNSVQMNPR